MEQLTILSQQNTFPNADKSCVFTGHRQLGEDFSPRKLKKAIKTQIENGVEYFYNGMAMGFDLFAAELVLDLKKKYPQIKLIACIPCYNQERYFSEEDKKRYVDILKKTDENVVLSDYYYRGCMQNRDKYMVDRCNSMITYCKKEEGGAAYTVRYFKKIHGEHTILFL
jgi:uncharacterized phage-like protein YoqJ